MASSGETESIELDVCYNNTPDCPAETSSASWQGADSVASFDSSTGNVTGLSQGSTTLTATYDDYSYGLTCDGYDCPSDEWEASTNVFVQVPSSLQVLSATLLTPVSGDNAGCPARFSLGTVIDIKYQVLDQSNNPITSSVMNTWERGTIGNGSAFSNPIGPVSGYSLSSASTASDGTFHDIPFGDCLPFSLGSGSKTATQTISLIIGNNEYFVRTQSFTLTTPGRNGGGVIQNNLSDISVTDNPQ